MTKTIVITGASDGIGAAAARQLALQGHRVVVVGRSPEKTRAVAEALGAEHHVADFARLDDVRRLAEALAALPRVDVLANNAGGIFSAREPSEDGLAKTLQINHLAGFLLTNLLIDKLTESRASVIQTASVAARAGRIELDGLGEPPGPAFGAAYSASKLANVLFTRELHRRYHGAGISTAAFHPGVVGSRFGSRGGPVLRFLNDTLGRALLTSPDKAAGQLVWLATSEPGRDWQPGAYYSRRRVVPRVNPQVDDAALARGLWERSAALTGLG